jgi:hypothetical protein
MRDRIQASQGVSELLQENQGKEEEGRIPEIQVKG